MREACAAEGGVEVDTQGDAFFFAFSSAPGALAAAQAITEALAAGPIQLRIGLHTGTPLVTDEGYVGDDVHFAARVAASGHGGQVVLSRATRELVDGLSLTDLGEHRLKDIDGAVVDLPARDHALSAAQDDLEHEPAAACELVRRPRSRARRGALAARATARAC